MNNAICLTNTLLVIRVVIGGRKSLVFTIQIRILQYAGVNLSLFWDLNCYIHSSSFSPHPLSITSTCKGLCIEISRGEMGIKRFILRVILPLFRHQ